MIHVVRFTPLTVHSTLAGASWLSPSEGKLQRQDLVKYMYLGVNIDRSVSWKSNIDKVRQKCFAGLASIRRVPCHTRKLLYQSLVLPHLDYCAVAWHSCWGRMSDQIERIQKYAMHVILRQPPHTSSEQLWQALGWTTLRRRWLHFNSLPAPVRSLTSRTAFKAALSRIDIAELASFPGPTQLSVVLQATESWAGSVLWFMY